MRKNIIIIFLLSLFLAGCSTFNIYSEPVPTPNCPQLASIKGNSKRYGLANWENCDIKSIDDKEVFYLWDGSTKDLRVTPVYHNFVIDAQFNRQFFGRGPYTASIELYTCLKPGKYHLNQSVKGTNVFVWIENEYNQRVSPMSSAPYHTAPRSQVIVMPVAR